MGGELAYFLTWTCYGSWLPEDERGSVDEAHRAYGTPYVAPDREREAANRSRMNAPEFRLDSEAREVVDRAIRDHAALREWRILALNVRSNHVHIVVVAVGYTPEQVMAQLKSWSTRRLRNEKLADPVNRVWTREGSTRHLFDARAVENAVRYVRDGQ